MVLAMDMLMLLIDGPFIAHLIKILALLSLFVMLAGPVEVGFDVRSDTNVILHVPRLVISLVSPTRSSAKEELIKGHVQLETCEELIELVPAHADQYIMVRPAHKTSERACVFASPLVRRMFRLVVLHPRPHLFGTRQYFPHLQR